jgi:hypothetical protein
MFKKFPQNINLMISKASTNPSDIRIITVTLKALTNLTYYSREPEIYKAIFNSLIDHLIFSVLSSFPKKQLIFVLLVRLIRNLFLYNKETTDQIIKKFNIPQLIRVYNNIKGQNVTLVEEMCEMLTQVVLYMEDYNLNEAAIYLISKDLIDIMIEGC